ncbi:MAG: adenylate/guanylate cyclase domain-containing protein [Pseudohongiellaceae bacterium]
MNRDTSKALPATPAQPMRQIDLDDFREREANAEKITCLVWLAVIGLTYVWFFVGFRETVSAGLFSNITLLVLVMTPAFALLAWLIHRGYYSPSIKYINTFLQVTLVSGAVMFDGLSQGPAYALSSMPPMAYALVPMITAFRLQPWLGLFAGAVAAVEFVLLYLFILRPDPAQIAAIPSLGFQVTMMKAVVLLALGVASALSARSLRNYFRNYANSQATRARLERNFGRFVSTAILGQIENSAEGRLAAKEQTAAIVFGDIRGFTAFSSNSSSIEVMRLLNDFFAIVCRVVEQEGGIVNKFLGDGYLAFFGVYSDDPNPCNSAARAMLRINRETEALLRPHGLHCGAAANYGEIVTGEVGSEGRCEFTGIGAAVNLAARLEGLNGRLDTSCLVSQDFVSQLETGQFTIHSLGEHVVRGLEERIPIFEIRG